MTDREIQFEVRRILVNEIFGHQEMIDKVQRDKDMIEFPELRHKAPITRLTTVKAVASSTVIKLNI